MRPEVDADAELGKPAGLDPAFHVAQHASKGMGGGCHTGRLLWSILLMALASRGVGEVQPSS